MPFSLHFPGIRFVWLDRFFGTGDAPHLTAEWPSQVTQARRSVREPAGGSWVRGLHSNRRIPTGRDKLPPLRSRTRFRPKLLGFGRTGVSPGWDTWVWHTGSVPHPQTPLEAKRRVNTLRIRLAVAASQSCTRPLLVPRIRRPPSALRTGAGTLGGWRRGRARGAGGDGEGFAVGAGGQGNDLAGLRFEVGGFDRFAVRDRHAEDHWTTEGAFSANVGDSAPARTRLSSPRSSA